MADGEATAAGELINVERSLKFDFWLTFSTTSTYRRGDPVRSPTVLVGNCPVCLLVFPRGSKKSGGKALSAFVEVCAGEDWVDGWVFPDVHYKIQVKNCSGVRKEVSKSDTVEFKADVGDRGWHELVKCKGYSDLKANGWIFPDDTVRFYVKVSGDSLFESQKRKREETSHAALMWQDLDFTDLSICAEDGGTELPCHRAVLAVCSPVFKRMLRSEMREGAERRLVLRNASLATLRCLLEYLYTNSLPEAALSDLQSLRELLQLADQYEIKVLLNRCASSLVEIMSPANIRDVLASLKALTNNPEVEGHLQQAKKRARQDDAMFEALVDC
mmetsp:Transcript_34328/g.69381  ORF Transcript_34328/g.69381 Transcript_34328/m.69381 type:complete len:330 (-) Transcript_34328:145-1134(-)